MSAIGRVVAYQGWLLRGVPLYTQERDVDMQVLSLKSIYECKIFVCRRRLLYHNFVMYSDSDVC